MAPAVQERQLFEQLARLRREQLALRARPVMPSAESQRSERLRQIDVESAAAWNGIRAARAAARAEYRARFAPAVDPLRAIIRRKPD